MQFPVTTVLSSLGLTCSTSISLPSGSIEIPTALLEGRFAVRIWGVKLPIQKFHFQESSVRETAEIQNSFMHKYLNFLICIQKKENIGSVKVHWWPVVM